LEEDFTGRAWKVNVLTLDQAKTQAHEKKEARKEEAEDHLGDEFLAALTEFGNETTKTKLRNRLTWNSVKFNRVLARLEQRGVVKVVVKEIDIGSGAKRSADVVQKHDHRDHRDDHRDGIRPDGSAFGVGTIGTDVPI
jgi:hypothetical protein